MVVDRKRPTGRNGPTGPTARPAGTASSKGSSATSEQEAALEYTLAAVMHLKSAAADKAAQVERLEHAISSQNGNGNGAAPAATHLLFVRTPDGYGLRLAVGEAPAPGAQVFVDGAAHVVAKLGPSPLPGDRRRCAYL